MSQVWKKLCRSSLGLGAGGGATEALKGKLLEILFIQNWPVEQNEEIRHTYWV